MGAAVASTAAVDPASLWEDEKRGAGNKSASAESAMGAVAPSVVADDSTVNESTLTNKESTVNEWILTNKEPATTATAAMGAVAPSMEGGVGAAAAAANDSVPPAGDDTTKENQDILNVLNSLAFIV